MAVYYYLKPESTSKPKLGKTSVSSSIFSSGPNLNVTPKFTFGSVARSIGSSQQISKLDPIEVPQKGPDLGISKIHGTISKLTAHVRKSLGRIIKLEKRVDVNAKKITLLKNVLEAKDSFGGKDDPLIETNRILVEIQSQLAIDFASRIAAKEDDLSDAKVGKEKKKRTLAEKSIEGIKSVAKGIVSTVDAVFTPVKGFFEKIKEFILVVSAGILANESFEWLKDPSNRQSLINVLTFIASQWKWIVGIVAEVIVFKVIRKIVQIIKGIWKILKFLNKVRKGIGSIFKHGLKRAGKRAALKVGGKVGAKTGAKLLGKSALKKIPLVGLGAALFFAGQRALSGDLAGAGLELASGAASTIPGAGTAASVGIDVALAARDIKRAGEDQGQGGSRNRRPGSRSYIPKRNEKQLSDNTQKMIKSISNSSSDDLNIIDIDIPTIQSPPPEIKTPSAGKPNPVIKVSSFNMMNEYMIKTPELHGIV